ncbi:glycosyltransferase family 2 protein [Leuconostoc citreum]|nr:glycosyltransferase family 2 protein [Leuconostoc citreum]MCT3061452.1 glycosyltransferase family 2 protein [Leuconostoc citreum]
MREKEIMNMNNNTFVIVTWNNEKEIELLIESLIKYAPGSSAIIVDNGSKDASVQVIKEKVNNYSIRLLEPKINLGFAKANNLAASEVKTKYITILNPDALLSDMNLQLAFDDLKNPDVGMVGGQLMNLDKTIQPSIYAFQSPLTIFIEQFGLGIILPQKLKNKWAPEKSNHDFKRNVDWLVGAFLVLKTDVYKKIGGFSEDYFLYSEDMDLAYKLKLKGLERVYNPQIKVYHIGGTSEKQDFTQKKRFKLLLAFSIFAKKYNLQANMPTLYISYLIKTIIFLPCSIINNAYQSKLKDYIGSVKYIKRIMGK